jgi:HEAT repeat protein
VTPPALRPAPTETAGAAGATSATSTESGAASLRAHFGLEMATRLLRRAEADERLRGLERVAAMHTPEAMALLARATEATVPGGAMDPRSPGEGAARQDPRAMLVVARGLAAWTDREAARGALERLLGASTQPIVTARAGTASARDPAAEDAENAARVALARQEAAMALAESGEPTALEALVAAARRAGPEQGPALDALAIHPPPPPLLGGVALTTPAMIALAASVGDLRSLGAILGQVKSSDPATRAAAIAALGAAGDARVLEVAREALKDKEPHVRVAAAEALARLGAQDAAQAVEALVADDTTAREALRVAQEVQDERVTRAAAARAAASADPELRALAVATLGRQTNPSAVTALVALAGDPRLEGDALDAIARSPCPAAMGALEALGAAPATHRVAARAYFVRRVVRGARSARLDALLAALANAADGADRAVGVQALVALGERPLEPALRDRDPRVRRAAAMAAPALGDAQRWAPTLLASLAVEGDEATRQVLALGLVAGDPDGVVPTLTLLERAQAGGPDAPLAALALARRSDEELAPRVNALLDSHDPVLRAQAARGLALSSAPDALGRLARAYDWEARPLVRRALVDALASRAGDDGLAALAPSGRAALEIAARLDPDRVARASARRALAGAPVARDAGAREVAWVRLVPAEGASLPRDLTAALVDARGVALPFAFDQDGYALVPGVPPGEAHVRLTARVPGYEPR